MVVHQVVRRKRAVKIVVVMGTVFLWLVDHVRRLVEMDS